MNKTKKVLLYGITIVVIVFSCIWEYYTQQWIAAQPEGGGAVIRVDAFVLWPLVLTLVSVSLFQLFKKK
ncbi:MAG: hypothetical protein K0U54_06210 [Bacteroidetes bacterium]|nr:hypothetical protein [Bacteroidota bacterium]